MTALYFLPWALALAVTAAWVIRQANRIGYLEATVADRERQIEQWKRRDEARDRFGHYGAGVASLAGYGFSVASRSELFGDGLPGDPPPPLADPPISAYSHMPRGWDGWNNYRGATGPAGVWAQRDRDRREGRR